MVHQLYGFVMADSVTRRLFDLRLNEHSLDYSDPEFRSLSKIPVPAKNARCNVSPAISPSPSSKLPVPKRGMKTPTRSFSESTGQSSPSSARVERRLASESLAQSKRVPSYLLPTKSSLIKAQPAKRHRQGTKVVQSVNVAQSMGHGTTRGPPIKGTQQPTQLGAQTRSPPGAPPGVTINRVSKPKERVPSGEFTFSVAYDRKRPKSEIILPKVRETKPRPPSIVVRKSNKNLNSTDELYSLLRKKFGSVLNNHSALGGSFAKPIAPSSLSSQAPKMFRTLTIYEKGEFMRKPAIYFTGRDKSVKPKIESCNLGSNFGFDDKDKNLNVCIGDHLNYRYEILGSIGNGSFGKVILCADRKYLLKSGYKLVAIKVIKNEMVWSLQAVNEIKTLKNLQQRKNNQSGSNVIDYFKHFHFRGHMCIVTEALSINIYQVLEAMDLKGMGLSLVSLITQQITKGLDFVHSLGIMHCDLKPENIMVSRITRSDLRIKIIDFGSSCHENELSYAYLQSRFYRAPEVLLGARYDRKIDIWSLATITMELVSGTPFFPGKSEHEMMTHFLNVLGPPAKSLIKRLRTTLIAKGPIGPDCTDINRGTLLWTAFDEDGALDFDYLRRKCQGAKLRGTTVERVVMKNFNTNTFLVGQLTDFISKCLCWNPLERSTSTELLCHPFIA